MSKSGVVRGGGLGEGEVCERGRFGRGGGLGEG